VANLSGLPERAVDAIEAALKGAALVPAGQAMTITRSWRTANVAAVCAVAVKLGLALPSPTPAPGPASPRPRVVPADPVGQAVPLAVGCSAPASRTSVN
jgi:hypothetical protein